MTRRRTFLTGLAGAGALAGLGALPAAAAASPVLPIRSCADWGARPPSAPTTTVHVRPVRILIHHTASANSTDFSQAHAYEHAHWIQDLHMDTNGWLDSGQHFTNSRGGFLMEGRRGSLAALRAGDRVVEGAHCPGQNTAAIGIENEGTYLTVEPPRTQWDSLVSFCVYTCEQYGIAPDQIHGHRDYRDTLCPGDRLYALLPRLRSEVAAVLA
ncbi:peptidoglycan recognition family protein [Saccharothrix longispora]|uniref:peptidoglycan recognition protein family protein n=1 Tax=Saccharothrix longispora TaxID=33920 RepID=UPI0028FD229E|nr:peptidoglycan recognition family protein [Saccharothrix longispora]MBY8848606.1 peptidoglycan recognition protein family protein [Saccharothrix sp. MB29]MDU0291350.1 peptidoglycan recognition family protein [Saccharothrix longispora]